MPSSAADDDVIAVLQVYRPCDALAADERAILRTEILEPDMICRDFQPRMMPGRLRRLKWNRRRRIAADRRDALEQRSRVNTDQQPPEDTAIGERGR